MSYAPGYSLAVGKRLVIDNLWGPELDALRGALGWSEYYAVGFCCTWWANTRAAKVYHGSRGMLEASLPESEVPASRLFDLLFTAGFIQKAGPGYCIVGNQAPILSREARRAAGAAGGEAKAKAPPPPPKKAARQKKAAAAPAPKSTEHQEATKKAWAAYIAAYEARYGVPPIRNAKVNGQMKNLVLRVGRDEAPDLLKFYVEHADIGYRRRSHELGMALRDAESLMTQYKTNRVVLQQDLQFESRDEAMVAQMRRIESGSI